MLPIILTISDGNDRFFVEELFNEHENRLYNIAYEILKDHHMAEDCVNDTFVKVISYLEKYKSLSENHRINLLMISCRNIAINLYNSRKKQKYNEISISNDEKDSEFDIVDENSDLEKIIINEERAEFIEGEINKLKETDREIIILKYYMGLRANEISDIMGMTESAVYSKVSRIKKILSEKLKDGDLL